MNPTQPDPNNLVDAAAHRVESFARARGTSRSERWLRSVVQNSSDIIVIYEDDGTVRYMSPPAERILGYKPEELVGTSAFDRVHPEDVELASRAFAEALENSGVMPPVEFRIRAADGSWRHMETILNNLLHDPDVGGIVANSRDITERKHAEGALREAEERYRAVIEQSIEGIYLGAADTKLVLESNAAFQKMLGYTAEELRGMHIYDFIAHDRENIDSVFQGVLAKGHHFIGERKYCRKDGSIVDVETSATVISYDNREVLCTVVRDITERKETEEALKESEERYRALTQNSSDIVTLLRADGTIRYQSPSVERILGYSTEEMVGDNVFNYVYPDDLGHVEMAFSEGLKDPRRRPSAEYRFRHKDGSWVWLESVGTNLLDDPQVGEYVVNSRDVTERKQAEEEKSRQVRHAALRAQVSTALAEGGTLPSILQRCTESMVWHLDAAFARIWTLNEATNVLELQASAGMYTRLDGAYSQIPVGKYKIGLIAQGRRPHLINNVVNDPRVHDKEWAKREGMVAFAGYPLIVEDRLVGVMAMSARQPLREDTIEALASVADAIAQGIQRKRAEEALKESEERYRAVMEQSVEAIYLYDAETKRVLESNEAFRRMMGYAEEELIGRQIYDFIAHDKGDIDANIWRSLREKRRHIGERRYRCKDGTVILVDTSASVISYEGRMALCAVSRDITERKEAEEALRRSKASLAESQRIAHLGTWEWDVVTGEVVWSEETFRIYGFEPNAFIPTFQMLVEVVHPDDKSILKAAIDDALAGIRPYDFEHRIVRPDGEERWVHRQAEVVRAEGGEPLRMIGTVHDITERKVLEERLEHQAFHDSLTDLPNRHLFVDRLKQALRRTRRKQGRQLAVLFMDLNDFKAINDSLGHEAGDLLLVVVAERLRRCLRPEDTLARFGGDEFVVLIEDVESPEDAVRVAERIVESLREPFVVEERELFLRASIGVALGTARQKSAEDLLRDADTAMYEAKEGRLGYRVFDPTMYERAVGRLEMENELRRAIEAEELIVHYQPIMSLQTGEVWGMEALVRWNHPERGLLDPWEFMAVAEQSGIVIPMGEQVLEEACRQAKAWQEEHPRILPLVMSVNLSARQLQRPDISQIVERVLKKTGLEARYLRLDITETVYIKALEGNTQALDELKRMGVSISIDDFGTGYSSLAYLKRLPAKALKVDKSFVKGIGEDLEDTAIVGMVIELAHTLGMEVIAEGVESEAQATLLKEMGCDMGQGFHFSEPLPPEAATRFLAEERTS
jgi:diguanylate cyclase (GGDEF)-like protein/PAS domain S-box-containing protein